MLSLEPSPQGDKRAGIVAQDNNRPRDWAPTKK